MGCELVSVWADAQTLHEDDAGGGSLDKEIFKAVYAVAERGLMYDWCICGGNYSLKNYAASVMPLLLASIREK